MEDYGIANTANKGLRMEFGTTPSKTIAFQVLDKHLKDHPEDRGVLQVVPLSEMEAA